MGEEIKTLKDGETQVIPKTTSKAVMNNNKESIENDINLINGSIETTASILNTITDETENNISQNLSELQIIKSDLKEAIIAKGVDIPYGTTFGEYAGKIGEIENNPINEAINITIDSVIPEASMAYVNNQNEIIVIQNNIQKKDYAILKGSMFIISANNPSYGPSVIQGNPIHNSSMGIVGCYIFDNDATISVLGGGGN